MSQSSPGMQGHAAPASGPGTGRADGKATGCVGRRDVGIDRGLAAAEQASEIERGALRAARRAAGVSVGPVDADEARVGGRALRRQRRRLASGPGTGAAAAAAQPGALTQASRPWLDCAHARTDGRIGARLGADAPGGVGRGGIGGASGRCGRIEHAGAHWRACEARRGRFVARWTKEQARRRPALAGSRARRIAEVVDRRLWRGGMTNGCTGGLSPVPWPSVSASIGVALAEGMSAGLAPPCIIAIACWAMPYIWERYWSQACAVPGPRLAASALRGCGWAFRWLQAPEPS